jgi:protein farnesyltransferase subunit beta
LAGLSAAHHHHHYRADATTASHPLDAAFRWTSLPAAEQLRDERRPRRADRVEPIHPVFVIPFGAVERTRAWCRARGGL